MLYTGYVDIINYGSKFSLRSSLEPYRVWYCSSITDQVWYRVHIVIYIHIYIHIHTCMYIRSINVKIGVKPVKSSRSLGSKKWNCQELGGLRPRSRTRSRWRWLGLNVEKKRWKTHRFPRRKSGKTHGVPKNYLQIVDFRGFSSTNSGFSWIFLYLW